MSAQRSDRSGQPGQSINRLLNVGLTTIIFLVLGLTFGLLIAMRYSASREQDIRDTYQPQLVLAEQMRAAVAEQQAGVRGFLLTGDERFLDPFVAGYDTYVHTRDRLQALPPLSTATSRLLDQQISIADAWYTEVAIPEVEARRAGPGDPDEVTATLDESHRRLSEFRSLQDEYVANVTGRIERASEDVEDLQRLIFISASIGGLAVVAVTALASFQIATAIRRPLSALGEVVTAVDGGAIDRRVESLSAREFDQLGQGINRMLQSLSVSSSESEVQRERLAAIVESANDGIVVVDGHGTVTLINPAAAQLLGTTVTTATGQPAADLGLLTDKEISAGIEMLGRPGQPVVRRHGERVLSAAVSEIHEPDIATDVATEAPGSVWVLRDVTDLIRIDEMKNEFISIVSHELRTPLTAIKGFTDLILEGEVGEITEQQREFLEIVQANSDRLVALISDMLDISRIESGRITLSPDEIDLPALVERTAITLRPLIDEKGLNFQSELSPTATMVMADEARLLQIMTNIISNACKYTPEGGWITVRTEALESQVAISVSDTGIGIPPDALPQVFSKFYRVDNPATREVGGTGLGLAITKSLVEMHGGKITIASRAGVGTTVRFTLPTVSISPEQLTAIDPTAMMPVVLISAGSDVERDDWTREIGRIPAVVAVPKARSVAAIVSEAERHPASVIVARCGNGNGDDLPAFDELLEELRGNPELSETPLIALVPDSLAGEVGGNVTVLPDTTVSVSVASAVRQVLPEFERDRVVRGRVLVAEDDQDIANWLRRVLASAGFEVTMVRDGLAAMVRAIEILPDAIVLDVNMPKLGAAEVLPQLRTNPGTKDIPVVIITGTVPDSRSYFMDAGASDFFAKPFDGSRLVNRLVELGKRSHSGPGSGG